MHPGLCKYCVEEITEGFQECGHLQMMFLSNLTVGGMGMS